MKHKINLVFEQLSLQKFVISHTIRKCIQETLNAEGVTARCEINVLVTDDAGIQVINRESRNLDKPTDVLSFPMFQLEAGNPPADWEEYRDPDSHPSPEVDCRPRDQTWGKTVHPLAYAYFGLPC